MKKLLGRIVLCLLLAIVFSPPASADQLSAARAVVIPEAIWAAASGGGTWVTTLQIHSVTANMPVYAQFFYGSGYRSVTITAVGSTYAHSTLRIDNILQHLGSIDTSFDYSGKVGTLLVYTSPGNTLWAQAMTVNGNYGKTMPSLVWQNTENTAAVGRPMAIPGIIQSAAYRTACGFWNSSSVEIRVRFTLMDYTSYNGLASVEKIIPANGFIAFNPFTHAGWSTTTTNSWLHVQPLLGGGDEGLFCFGSVVNNATNDSYALIAIPFN